MKPEITIQEFGRGKEMNLDQIIQLIHEGRQLGVKFTFLMNGENLFADVGIQKWNGLFKVYIFEILESKMVMDEEEREIGKEFKILEDAIDFVHANSYVKLEQFTSWKGRKIFNPNCGEWL